MNQRERLNAQHQQQAVQFAEQFTKPEKTAFLQEVEARHAFEQSRILQKNVPNRPLAKILMTGLLAVVLAAVAVYWQTERYQQVQQGSAAFSMFQQQQSEKQSEQRNDDYILTLQNQLRENPNNGERWFELAQAYALNNEFENALICYANAEKVLGKQAAIYGGMATAEYYRAKHQITPQVKAWLEQALAQDPKESAALLLLASDAFLRNQFADAITYWETVLESENQAIDKREIIRSIQLAKQRLQAE